MSTLFFQKRCHSAQLHQGINCAECKELYFSFIKNTFFPLLGEHLIIRLDSSPQAVIIRWLVVLCPSRHALLFRLAIRLPSLICRFPLTPLRQFCLLKQTATPSSSVEPVYRRTHSRLPSTALRWRQRQH